MKRHDIFKILICFLGVGLSFSIYATTPQPNPPFIFSYPGSSADINNYAKNIEELDKFSHAIKGMATKVYQIIYKNPSSTKYSASMTNLSCNTENIFFSGCINANLYLNLTKKSNNLALINVSPGNYALTEGQATKMLEILNDNKLNDAYSGVIIDAETLSIPLTSNGRSDFFEAAIKGFNELQLPVGIYLSPNPLVAVLGNKQNVNSIGSTVTALNKIMNSGTGLAQKSYNYYAIPLYGSNLTNSKLADRLYSGRLHSVANPVIPAITAKPYPVHFKFIIDVQKGVTAKAICTTLTNLVTPSANNPYFSGLVLYQYADSSIPTAAQVGVINDFIDSGYKSC